MPKPFLDLLGTGKSLLQLTYERCKTLCKEDNILVSTTEQYASLVNQQLPHLKPAQVLIEPANRGAATGVAYAAYRIRKIDPAAIITTVPADHAVFGEIAFSRDIGKAIEVAASDQNKILMIGIKPTKPETNYRYIQYHYDSGGVVKKVKTLTDKPQIELANLFLNSGDFVWNTDIYIWHVNSIIRAIEQFLPDLAELFASGMEFYGSEEEATFLKKTYSHCKNIPLSYGILEKAENLYVMLGNFDWSAIDSWTSLFALKNHGGEENAIEANALALESNGCYIKSVGKKFIIVHSLRNYLVADSPDVLLICPKSEAERLKHILKQAEDQRGDKYL